MKENPKVKNPKPRWVQGRSLRTQVTELDFLTEDFGFRNPSSCTPRSPHNRFLEGAPGSYKNSLSESEFQSPPGLRFTYSPPLDSLVESKARVKYPLDLFSGVTLRAFEGQGNAL